MAVPYFPFTGETYQPKMGLKPLEWHQWIEFDLNLRKHLELKERLFREERGTVLHILPGADDYCLELHEKLQENLLAFHGEKFRSENGEFISLISGDSFSSPAQGEEALEQISRWMQEDWCLLGPEPPNLLVAALVCFPSRWSLAEKMGKTSDEIHEPVPEFQSLLAGPARNFLEKLVPTRPMWRLNWTIHDSDELFCPGPTHSSKILTAENVIENCFLRVERQTLCRLPKTGAIAFSIRTHLNPLSEVVGDAGKKELLHRSLLGLPEETAVYRGMGSFLKPLLAALAAL